MYHIVYKTTLVSTGEYYIGKHTTKDLNDGYRGSGRWVVVQPKTATRTEILSMHASEAEALAAERVLVDQHLGDPLCRNMTRGGRGSMAHLRGRKPTPEENAQRSASLKKTLASRDPEKTAAWREALSRPCPAKGLPGERNPFWGKRHSPEARAKMASSRTSEQRAAAAAGNANVKGRAWFNDGRRSYLLDTAEAVARGLAPGRLAGEMYWYNDGSRNYRLPEAEGESRALVRGRIGYRRGGSGEPT